MQKTSVLRQMNSLFIGLLGVQVSAFNTCHFTGHQRGVTGVVLRAEISPHLQLPMVHANVCKGCLSGLGRGSAAQAGSCQGAVEGVFGLFNECV